MLQGLPTLSVVLFTLKKIYKNNKVKTGWAVGARFEICLHIKDRGLLEKIQGSLGGVGAISTRNNYVQYIVSSPKDLKVIIDHLDKYSLITQKEPIMNYSNKPLS